MSAIGESEPDGFCNNRVIGSYPIKAKTPKWYCVERYATASRPLCAFNLDVDRSIGPPQMQTLQMVIPEAGLADGRYKTSTSGQ